MITRQYKYDCYNNCFIWPDPAWAYSAATIDNFIDFNNTQGRHRFCLVIMICYVLWYQSHEDCVRSRNISLWVYSHRQNRFYQSSTQPLNVDRSLIISRKDDTVTSWDQLSVLVRLVPYACSACSKLDWHSKQQYVNVRGARCLAVNIELAGSGSYQFYFYFVS